MLFKNVAQLEMTAEGELVELVVKEHLTTVSDRKKYTTKFSKKRRIFNYAICLLLIFFLNVVNGDETDPEKVNINEINENILFVGLGSSCEAANVLRYCGVRKAAFPFDWILTTDGKKIIEILENDFLYFMDKEYLVPARASSMILLHTYYNMEFHHEGEWRGDANYLTQNMDKLITKYQRRVERFRQLKNFHGKVVFIRFAKKYSMETNVYYRRQENIEITDEYSLRLYNALKKYFPELNFHLIIVNTHLHHWLEEKDLLNNILMIRCNPRQPHSVKKDYFDKFFSKLIHCDH